MDWPPSLCPRADCRARGNTPGTAKSYAGTDSTTASPRAADS